jgi:hypothetical protein
MRAVGAGPEIAKSVSLPCRLHLQLLNGMVLSALDLSQNFFRQNRPESMARMHSTQLDALFQNKRPGAVGFDIKHEGW